MYERLARGYHCLGGHFNYNAIKTSRSDVMATDKYPPQVKPLSHHKATCRHLDFSDE